MSAIAPPSFAAYDDYRYYGPNALAAFGFDTKKTSNNRRPQTHGDGEEGRVLLSPRPLAAVPAAFLLVPLLPIKRPLKPLPAEVWAKIIRMAIEAEEDIDGGANAWPRVPDTRRSTGAKDKVVLKWRFLLVCKEFKVRK